MPPTEGRQRVVVGVDGSTPSLSALAWAADLVSPGGELHVVTCGHPSTHREEVTQRWLDRLPIEPQLHVFDHPPAQILTEFAVASHADLLVIGAHGGLAGAPRTLGSVTHRLLRSSPCPLSIVSENVAAPANAPIVVGIGDGPATRAAVDWAAQFAEEEDRPLQLVRAVNIRPIFGVDNAVEVMASYIDSHLLKEWAEAEVDLVAGEMAGRGLDVSRTVQVGRAGKTLVDASVAARIVVVGKHLDGPITGYFTGVTLHHVLTHAACPVVVVAATSFEVDDADDPQSG